MVKSRRTASSCASPKALSLRIRRSTSATTPFASTGSSSTTGVRRNVATSMTLPPPNRTCTKRNRRPMIRERSEEHTSELQSPDHLVCRLLLEKKKRNQRGQDAALWIAASSLQPCEVEAASFQHRSHDTLAAP